MRNVIDPETGLSDLPVPYDGQSELEVIEL